METVLVSKDKLLKKMRENRAKHREQFEAALAGWQQTVLEALEQAVEDARDGKKYPTAFHLPQPQDHTDEYTDAIEAIEWNEEEQIELDRHEFRQFVRDDWGWKRDFLTSNSAYMSKSGWTEA